MSPAGVSASANLAGSVLAFDFGTKKIGVAVGELAIGMAHPLTTIVAENAAKRFAAIARLLDEWRPALLIVGLPVHAEGEEHALTAQARRFAHQLHGRFGLPVKLVDERFTSQVAGAVLRDANVSIGAQRALRDQVAAQLILQAYFDQRG